uniref:Uncharacterized protein n=1 Tax=Octactis speculum TaxID=3111310 RepID=A0A7S2MNN6_9STRA
MKDINLVQPVQITASGVKWVVTVPAIWTDPAKAFMRTAALNAGLIDTIQSDRLQLALEPEAACMACENDARHLKEGDEFMILDCGGGTVDITMHKVVRLKPLHLDELCIPAGGPWGSTFVDQQFEVLVRKLIGESAFLRFKPSPYWVELMDTWEIIKTSFADDESRPRSVNFAPVFEVLEDGVKLVELAEAYNAIHNAGLKVRGKSTLLFPPELTKGLILHTVRKIENQVSDLIERNPVGSIFIVGGFAESSTLQNRMKSRFSSDSCKVIVPKHPGVAVLNGAVLFGLDKRVFLSRRARLTYGTSIRKKRSMVHEEKLPPDPDYKIFKQADGTFVEYVCDIFSEILGRGDKIQCGETIQSGNYIPTEPNQRNIFFPLLCVDAPSNTTYHTRGTKQIGTLTVPISNADESVKIYFSFGETELCVEARGSSGISKKLHVDYNFNFI